MAIGADEASELFRELGEVRVRRMFGGAGLYHDGVMFALEADGVLYLKADAEAAEAFRAEGSEPFSYVRSSGRRTMASYWRLPERLMDEPDELAAWARRSAAVARAAAARPKRRRP
ncbi:TfoX/Sxy family protein [Methylopila henanensis]|uniref:TfoX/Sxy family protein n=1 Tax=Methylopila henanensis TaxID=873516 RepID=A0ABW4K4Y7_9HYPH